MPRPTAKPLPTGPQPTKVDMDGHRFPALITELNGIIPIAVKNGTSDQLLNHTMMTRNPTLKAWASGKVKALMPKPVAKQVTK